MGVYIHNLKDKNKKKCKKGQNPFKFLSQKDPDLDWRLFTIYDWKEEDGYNNFAQWVEDARQSQYPEMNGDNSFLSGAITATVIGLAVLFAPRLRKIIEEHFGNRSSTENQIDMPYFWKKF